MIKVIIVPGKSVKVNYRADMTVMDAAREAAAASPDVDFVELAKTREVYVGSQKFSNTEEVPEGYAGTIHRTPLQDRQIVMILKKIRGNVGEACLSCTIDGDEYGLESPDTLKNILGSGDITGYDMNNVKAIYVDGEEAHPEDLVRNGDFIEVEFYSDSDDQVTVDVDGHRVTGRPADIKRVLNS